MICSRCSNTFEIPIVDGKEETPSLCKTCKEEKYRFDTVLSKRNIPCLWEFGGSEEDEGTAFLIGYDSCLTRRPLFVQYGNKTPNKNHALIPIDVSNILVYAARMKDTYVINVYRVTSVDPENVFCTLEHQFLNGTWDVKPEETFTRMIETAKIKAKTQNCTTAFWIDKTLPEKKVD